jgi:hypothetical protein
MRSSGKRAKSEESYGCTLVGIKPAATIPVEFDASALGRKPTQSQIVLSRADEDLTPAVVMHEGI